MLPENEMYEEPKKQIEDAARRKQRLLKDSKHPYEMLAWWVYSNLTSKNWFEAFVLANIVLTGIASGMELENRGRNDSISFFVDFVSLFTMVVFTLEVVLKLIAEAFTPLQFFIDKIDGSFNTFDFGIVAAGYIFMGMGENSAAVGALRMLRLIRLLTFIKGVRQLRVIVAGIIQGLKSVLYICMLLFLVIYMFAIMGCLLFGDNDPARFGTVPIAA